MNTRRVALVMSALALATASFAANAAILYQNLGTAAPPAALGSYTMTAFDQVPQAAIPDFTSVSSIPGSPTGTLSISPSANKRTVPNGGWASAWGHGYAGPVFFTNGSTTATLTLPAGTKAFYFYMHGDSYGTRTFTATTNSGATSGAIPITTSAPGGAASAIGFAFYSTAGETITSITITGDDDFSVAEFGINGGVAKTCASEGYTGTKLTWCKNICEMGYTGATLDLWIHRWIGRYRDLPYCAVEGGEEPPPPPQDA
jgi:hypothetical protein